MEGSPPPPLRQSSSCSVEYTSLKDIIPWQKSSYSYNYRSVDSWREIPIKDPLLQHAAWAYLLPTSSSSSQTNTSRGSGTCVFLSKLKDKCQFCLYGCFGGFLEDAVWSKVRSMVVNDVAYDDEEDSDDGEGMQEDHSLVEI